MPHPQQRARLRHEQLVSAADRLIRHKGFQNVRLAEIARAARVPSGGVYYYFPTREDVVTAVIDRRVRELEARTAAWDALPTPAARLDALVQVWFDEAELDSRYGCPQGSLCYELARHGGPLADQAARPLRALEAWCLDQFGQMGLDPVRARGCARHLLCQLQGASLLGNAYRDAQLIREETGHIRRWLAGAAPTPPAARDLHQATRPPRPTKED